MLTLPKISDIHHPWHNIHIPWSCRVVEFLRWCIQWAEFHTQSLPLSLKLQLVEARKWQKHQDSQHLWPAGFRKHNQKFQHTSRNVLKTGKPKCRAPPLFGVTPPTIFVPYLMACCEWNVPYKLDDLLQSIDFLPVCQWILDRQPLLHRQYSNSRLFSNIHWKNKDD